MTTTIVRTRACSLVKGSETASRHFCVALFPPGKYIDAMRNGTCLRVARQCHVAPCVPYRWQLTTLHRHLPPTLHDPLCPRHLHLQVVYLSLALYGLRILCTSHASPISPTFPPLPISIFPPSVLAEFEHLRGSCVRKALKMLGRHLEPLQSLCRLVAKSLW